MIQTLRFIRDAVLCGCAYIDLDGCLLKRFRCPKELKLSGARALIWWMENLAPTPIVYRRLALLYVLRLLGVRVIMWTNRTQCLHHLNVTHKALRRHMWLFAEMRFRDGQKIMDRVDGPVMDDQPAYLKCGIGPGLLVEQL